MIFKGSFLPKPVCSSMMTVTRQVFQKRVCASALLHAKPPPLQLIKSLSSLPCGVFSYQQLPTSSSRPVQL